MAALFFKNLPEFKKRRLWRALIAYALKGQGTEGKKEEKEGGRA